MGLPQKNLSLAELKRDIDLVALVREYGVELKRHGKNFVGRCPFHEDKSPSFVVTPGKNLWHCLGACQMGGSAIDFVMKKERVSLREAVSLLKKKSTTLIVTEPQTAHPKKQSTNQTPALTPNETPRKSFQDFSEEEQNLIDRVFDYYQETLYETPEAREYLKSRGVYDEKILRKFCVGCSNGTLVERFLPSGESKAGKKARRVLTEFGLLREKQGHEHFRGYLVFPLFDEDGHPAGAYGRYLTPIKIAHETRHRYMRGPHTGLWNREAFREKELVLCESVIDALTLYVNGIRNATCSYGVQGYTQELHSEILKQNPKRVRIAYDNDTSGNKAAEGLANRLLSEGISCNRVLLPFSLDVNDYAVKVENPEEKLQALLLDAEVMRETSEEESEHRTEKEEDIPLKESEKAKEKTGEQTNAKGFEVTRSAEEIVFRKGEREYRVRSLYRNQSLDQMKVNLKLVTGEDYYIETLDLMNQRMRKGYIQNASEATGTSEETITNDLKEVFRETEELLWEHLEKLKKPEREEKQLTAEEREEALLYLKDTEIVARILEDFERMGLVGERTNSLLGYLATLTRRTENPLAVIIQSSSSAGKSTLMDSILDLVPEEEKEKYSAMTGQSLFYMSSTNLKNKVLAISEEEGIERAKYALKILQSEKRISIATTTKDQLTGKLATTEYVVEGPVVLFLTTTSIEIDEELQNRSVILTVNEEREQTKTILRNQREDETLEGVLKRKKKEGITILHQNIQRLILPLSVVNPYANELKFPDTKLRMRRDQKKYLTLIRTIALLHQYQREVKIAKDDEGKEISYIEVEKSDIELAGVLFSRVFGKNLDDLSPHTKKLLKEISEYVDEVSKERAVDRSAVRLTRKEIRERTGVSDTRLRVHLKRLEELEYLYARSGKQGIVIEYELLWEEERENENEFSLTLFKEEPSKPESNWKTLLSNSEFSGKIRTSDLTSPSKTDTSPPVRLPLTPPLPGGRLVAETAHSSNIPAHTAELEKTK
ncbi:CHC2 zinc finger domain-containing protein [Leptospira sanjuanensis]|uniref:CHC2 zinc finger domain-containing protein n=1 Tax=Leptospira sanjuanensis TaxID=2879643 RepID=UPI001EE85AC1|nr:CHC2 zinc finger domain-containing protein [Leptospira sanjuanensis]MCG6167192.1 CHC2 zinc finger domain-containing protein [Leptospira sanjuanensis]MCG6167204.1 CHC2 zinc finger domain-containing protein [Leptospira sanjuanensis]